MKYKSSKNQLRNFGLLIGFSFPIFIGLIIPLITGQAFRLWTLWIGIIFLLFSIFKPALLAKPFEIWMNVGMILSWFNSRLILGLIFVLVVQPISFFMKIFGYDPLRTKKVYLKTYKEDTSNRKINLNRIF